MGWEEGGGRYGVGYRGEVWGDMWRIGWRCVVEGEVGRDVEEVVVVVVMVVVVVVMVACGCQGLQPSRGWWW